MLSRLLSIKQERGLLPLIGIVLDYSSDIAVSVIFLANTEFKAAKNADIDWSTRLWLWRHGFISTAPQVFDFDRHAPEDYLSHAQHRLRAVKIDEPLIPIFHDKKIFDQLLSDFNKYLPECYGEVSEGEIQLLNSQSARSIVGFITNQSSEGFIIKPTEGMGGDNVDIIESNEDGLLLNNKQKDLDDIVAAIKNHTDSLIYQRIQQADYAAEIYADSPNTLRVVTMIDPDTDQAFVARAVHRFGTKESAPVDNWSRGGICAGVDLETGELMKVAETPDKEEIERREDHPDTGIQITGVKVKHWEKIREEICSISKNLSRTPYIGWDILVTEDSFKIIEGNGRPGPNTMQIPGPLLTNKRVQRFYQHHGVI